VRRSWNHSSALSFSEGRIMTYTYSVYVQRIHILTLFDGTKIHTLKDARKILKKRQHQAPGVQVLYRQG
jgi:hypothetical protein